jgi:hypothetical protein
MKKADFNQVTNDIPKVIALFKLTRVGKGGQSLGHKKGDTFVYHKSGCMVAQRLGQQTYTCKASEFEFVGYFFATLKPTHVYGQEIYEIREKIGVNTV